MDTKVLKALGEPTRYHLLELMAERAYCVKALAHKSGLSEPAVSQHLKILREAGLVHGTKWGFYTHYRVDREALTAAANELLSLTVVERKPCDRPFYGCPESAAIHCSSYVPPEERK